MKILCTIEHKPVESHVWHNGYYFSRCSRCQCELVRKDDSCLTPWAKHEAAWRRPVEKKQEPSFDFLTTLVQNWGFCEVVRKMGPEGSSDDGIVVVDMPAAH